MNFSNLWDTLSIFSFFLLDRSNTSYIFLLKIPDPQRFIDRCAIHPSRSCLVKLRSLREERSCATFSFRSNFFPVFWRVHDAITPDYLANDSENGLAKKAISIRLPSEKKKEKKRKERDGRTSSKTSAILPWTISNESRLSPPSWPPVEPPVSPAGWSSPNDSLCRPFSWSWSVARGSRV